MAETYLNLAANKIAADEIKTITPFDDTERIHINSAIDWAESGVNIFRIAKPDIPATHLVSYFVLIDPDHNSLLLGDHVKSLLQLPSGGHVEPGEAPVTTVRRESVEELGMKAAFLGEPHPFFLTITQTNPLSGPTTHTDVSLWYLLRGNIRDYIQFERREFNDMTWWNFDEILQTDPTIFDPHMQRFTKKLMHSLSA